MYPLSWISAEKMLSGSDHRVTGPGNLGGGIGSKEINNVTAPMVLDIALGIRCGENNGHFAEQDLEALARQFDVRASQYGGLNFYNGKTDMIDGHSCAFYYHFKNNLLSFYRYL